MLSDIQKSLLTTTRGDMHRLNLCAVALLRGRACAAELNAMAAMCKPGKTKHLPAELRGFLAFQSTLDRFAMLIREADDDGILRTQKSDGTAVHSIPDAQNPSDVCVEATAFEKVSVGKAALIKDHGILQFARGLYIQLKAKYGDRLTAERTLPLKAATREKVAKTQKEKAQQAFAKLSQAEKDQIISELTGIPVTPAQEPEVLEVPADQVVTEA
jgi:hypothetical protein